MTRTQLYSPPRIVSHGDDLRKRWHVVFYHLHPLTGKMQRLRIYADLARYTSKRHRSMAARRLRKAIAQALQEGWSPFEAPVPTLPAPALPVAVAEAPPQTNVAAHAAPQEKPVPPRISPQSAPQKAHAAAHPLLLALQKAHRERCQGVRQKTVSQYHGYFSHVLHFVQQQGWQEMPVATFGVAEAKALMTYVGERGLTNKTRNKYLQYYRGLFQTLVDEELAIKNPFEKIKKLKQTTEGYVPFNAEQVTELLAYFRQHDRPLYQFVCCIYYGFLRPKEIRLLRVRDVDFRNRIIRVPAEVGKTGQRFVDINQPFAEMLDREGLVWADSDVPLVPAALGTDRLFSENGAALRHRKLLRKLGYGPEYKLYAWKHSGVIAAYTSGLDVMTIKQMCGHSSVQMTDIYLSNIGLVRSSQAKAGAW